ncbi:uncharacterized protein BCR38DRAFT_488725 [Pseudomassariella vexata]|uniref:Uncharacterized protein n=1 Tax=Pseudomassariella vexata TaxID=1141098 RepID=A0A1Y2DKA9_9PEZI|nr:uncharacterized protein BCR38DRAFT_488725 [Pseudomassariella vexata]ORY59707.1 hypothetical protein BCR38DRAFT_488725 [Pseudomassariella vexata]
MHAFRSRSNRPKQEVSEDSRPRSPRSPHSPQTEGSVETAAANSAQPGFISRLLRRAQSKKNLRPKSSSHSARESTTIPDNNKRVEAEINCQEEQTEVLTRKTSSRHKTTASRSRFYSDPPPTTEAPGIKRPLQVYIPKHAAADFSRMPISPRDITARYSSLDEERRLTLSPPPPQLPRSSTSTSTSTSIGQTRDESELLRDARRPTVATIDTMVPNDEGLDRVSTGEALDKTFLQPPPSSLRLEAKRHSHQKRHSFKIAADPRKVPEKDHESSDYQLFMQKAMDDERHEREELWRTISQRSRRTPMVIDHPDVNMNVCSLQRSGTFGDKEREKRTSKRLSNSWKRASHVSRRQSVDEHRRSFIYGGDTATVTGVSEGTNRDLQRKSSVTKRIQEYVKPERPDKVPGTYEETEYKSLSRKGSRRA